MQLPTKRLDQLTFLRFLAALWVFAFHLWPELSAQPMYQMWVQKGHLGVSFFYVLSGYVLTISQSNKLKGTSSWRQFWIARIVRILPAYWVAFLLTIVLRWTLESFLAEPVVLITSAMALQAFFFPLSPIFMTGFPLGWSITVELFFYALFPYILRQFRFDHLWKITIFLWLATLILTSWPNQNHEIQHHFPFVHLNQLLWGIVAGQLFLRGTLSTISPGFFWITGLVGFALLLKFAPNYPGEWPWLPAKWNLDTGFLAPFFAMVMLGISREESLLTRTLRHPVLVYLGEISYSFYLLQEVSKLIFQGIWGTTWMPYGQYALLVFLINLGLSCLVYHVVEKPSMKWWKMKSKI